LFLSIIGALIIQTLATTIIVSGLPAKFNLLIKAIVILTVLLLQSEKFRHQLSGLFKLRVFKGTTAGDKK